MEDQKRLCHHYHRERMDWAKGQSENRPREEVCFDFDDDDDPFDVVLDSHGIGRRKINPYDEKKKEEVKYCYNVKVSDLVPISNTQCRCSECGQTFPIEKVDQMGKLFERMNELYDLEIPKFSDVQFLKLHQGLEPVWYRKKNDGNAEILGIETNPRNWHFELSLGSYWEIPDRYVHVISFGRLPDDHWAFRGSFCKHYYGAPYCVLKHPTNPSLPEFAGVTESLLSADSDDICECRKCHKVFSEEEQAQMKRLLAYLNTPHYCSAEDMSCHEEWREIIKFYDHGYIKENEPFQLFNLEKAVELSKGIEPVWYDCRFRPNRMVIWSAMKWKNGAWRIEEKIKGFLRSLIR